MSKEINAEVVVLGSGPGGYSAAFRAADLGLDTVLIERYSTLWWCVSERWLYPVQSPAAHCQAH